jgi:phenylpropionate dioxygenase-like ring-hydroxylating dioxygenase large terminal subunit
MLETQAAVDLRRVGLHPERWHPVAWSHQLRPGGLLRARFAGDSIALARAETGRVFALEDRCAHRQVPLSLGVLEGEQLRCGYHGWRYGADGRCAGQAASVRVYPVREAHGLLFVYPGEPAGAAAAALPSVPAASDPRYRTRRLSRRIRCHYSFMHENLMDMNHQFLHRRLMGAITPVLLSSRRGPDWVEAVYRFTRTAGRQSWGERFMIGANGRAPALREHDVMTIRTEYPHQTLTFSRADSRDPELSLWLAYVPQDREQRENHSFGLMSVKRPDTPGLIHLFWPFIALFTDAILRQDQQIVEREQRAWDEAGRDLNHEPFPLILAVRDVLRRNGVPLK